MNRYFAVLFLGSVAIMPVLAEQGTGTNNAPPSSGGTLPLTSHKNLSPLEQTLIN
jgi:hypothetical protein